MFTTQQYQSKANESGLSDPGHLRVEVKHRCPTPNQYTWEIYRNREALPVAESFNRFCSWEEASQAGKKVLKKLLANELSIKHRTVSIAAHDLR